MKHVNSEQLGCVRRRNVFEECYAKQSGAVAGPNANVDKNTKCKTTNTEIQQTR